jgi:hypothetical protein
MVCGHQVKRRCRRSLFQTAGRRWFRLLMKEGRSRGCTAVRTSSRSRSAGNTGLRAIRPPLSRYDVMISCCYRVIASYCPKTFDHACKVPRRPNGRRWPIPDGQLRYEQSPKPAVRSALTVRPVSTQVGHWAAGEAIQEPDIQRRWAATALRPSLPFPGQTAIPKPATCSGVPPKASLCP